MSEGHNEEQQNCTTARERAGLRYRLHRAYFPAGFKPWQADRGKQHHENSAHGGSSGALSAEAANQVP